MNPARRRSDRFSDIFEKSDDVVIGSLFDLEDLGDRKSRAFSNLRSVLFRNLAKFRHRLAGEHFNFQPDLKLALVRPDFAHLRPGITIDHVGNIKATGVSEKRFVACAAPQRITERSPLRTADTTAFRLSERTSPACLAHAGAQETSVILYAHLAAGQKIGDRCDHLCAASRTRTHRQNQITKRKPSAWSDNLAKLTISFHKSFIPALSR